MDQRHKFPKWSQSSLRQSIELSPNARMHCYCKTFFLMAAFKFMARLAAWISVVERAFVAGSSDPTSIRPVILDQYEAQKILLAYRISFSDITEAIRYDIELNWNILVY